ncbi:cytochrome d ubiquinol oxidase subunit II [Streptomyces sp. NPDC006464]|uniref:cytochrome d ubiquinol oxidase subunit II n=1 Tax=Streptomyces sp. NPDC006464 TaxID=3154305 RepID=UPI0033A16C3B
MLFPDTLAVVLPAFFATGWFILGGSDLGTGMLLPYLGRTAHERRLVIASFAPFFLGNEVWLIATAAVLAGCFPTLEGELLAGQYPVLVALLAGWVVRDTGLWSRGRVSGDGGRRRRALCDAAVVCGSWTVALSVGLLLAALLTGAPYEPVGGPAGVLVALAVAALFAVHGLGFATLRLTGPPFERARLLVGRNGPWQSFALTAVLLGALPLVAGGTLPLAGRAADPATIALLVPALLVVTPFLVAAQVWTWIAFRRRVTGPSYL